MLIHIVTCSKHFDLNKTVTLRTGGQQKRLIFLQIFTQIFLSDLSIPLLQNISVLNKSRKLVFCDRVDCENKTQNAFKPINSTLYRCKGVIIDRDERYSLHSAEVYMCLKDVRDRSAIMVCDVKFGAKILPHSSWHKS